MQISEVTYVDPDTLAKHPSAWRQVSDAHTARLNSLGAYAREQAAPVHTLATISGISHLTVQRIFLGQSKLATSATLHLFACALSLWLTHRPNDGSSLNAQCVEQAKQLDKLANVGG